jgi:hypothetical protein
MTARQRRDGVEMVVIEWAPGRIWRTGRRETALLFLYMRRRWSRDHETGIQRHKKRLAKQPFPL